MSFSLRILLCTSKFTWIIFSSFQVLGTMCVVEFLEFSYSFCSPVLYSTSLLLVFLFSYFRIVPLKICTYFNYLNTELASDF